MIGIEILTQTAITVPQAWVLPVFGILFIIAIIFLSLWAQKETKIRGIIALVSLVSSITLLFLGGNVFSEPTGYYQYIGHIDDSVSMVEFNEKYDLISTNGDIYIFKDKIPEEKGNS